MPGRSSLTTSGNGVAVKVEGLTELRAALKAAGDKATGRDLQRGLKAAAEIVARDARSRVPTGPERGGHVVDTIKAGATQSSAYIAGGKKESPYYGWLDFGSRTPRKQVGPWARSGKGPRGGRFIYPAIEANQQPLVKAVDKAVGEALKSENL